jgi:hypothetical protein
LSPIPRLSTDKSLTIKLTAQGSTFITSIIQPNWDTHHSIWSFDWMQSQNQIHWMD